MLPERIARFDTTLSPCFAYFHTSIKHKNATGYLDLGQLANVLRVFFDVTRFRIPTHSLQLSYPPIIRPDRNDFDRQKRSESVDSVIFGLFESES